MENVFIVHVDKKSTFDMTEYNGFNHMVGSNIGALKKAIEEIYGKNKAQLLKDENDNFPYFTDGGFKYTMHTENWIYTFTCYDIEFHQ